MKTLIIALLISSVVSGQKPASQTLPIDFFIQRGDISYKVKDTVSAINEIKWGSSLQMGYSIFYYPMPAHDTISTMFLVTDTSIAKSVYQVFAIKGFRVLENGYGYNADMTTSSMKYLISYLDSNKKPLPNTWVVWQTSIY